MNDRPAYADHLRDQEWFQFFLLDTALMWEREASEIEQLARNELCAGREIEAAACLASCETLQAVARAFRGAIPTEQHEWDQTLADIVDLPEVAA